MSKELEALKEIKNYIDDNITTRYNHVEPEIEIIEEALQRLEAIDNANSSEALECLEYIENKLKDLEYVAKQNDNEYLLSKYIPSEKFKTIKQALIKAQEFENVLKKYNIENIEELEKILKIFFMKG